MQWATDPGSPQAANLASSEFRDRRQCSLAGERAEAAAAKRNATSAGAAWNERILPGFLWGVANDCRDGGPLKVGLTAVRSGFSSAGPRVSGDDVVLCDELSMGFGSFLIGEIDSVTGSLGSKYRKEATPRY